MIPQERSFREWWRAVGALWATLFFCCSAVLLNLITFASSDDALYFVRVALVLAGIGLLCAILCLCRRSWFMRIVGLVGLTSVLWVLFDAGLRRLPALL
jgi:uncharacterized membrane protein YjjP (DUF1212 family)